MNTGFALETVAEIDWMQARDYQMVLDIESRAFNEFERWMGCEIDDATRSKEYRFCHVARNRVGDVLGYYFWAKHRGAVEIVRIAVDPQYQRMGIGKFLVDHLKKKHLKPGRSIFCDVSEYNLAAHLFLKANNFVAYAPRNSDFYRFAIVKGME